MSENIPESIPTSADPRSKRPTKKARPTTAVGQQNAAVEALFAKQPDIQLPSASRGPKTAADLAPPPEIVTNVQGSSAGAGSGEFHVYKAARRREHERMRLMDEEAKREEMDKDFAAKQAALKQKDDSKTSKNRKRREKQRANRGKTGGGLKPAPGLSARKANGAAADDEEHAIEGEAGKALPEEQGLTIAEDD